MKHTDRNKPPITSPPIFDELPTELRPLKQWVLWRYVWKWRNEEQTEGTWAKIPMRPDGTPASSTNPEDWSTFDTVVLAYNQREAYFSGIGFVFTRNSGYVGIDLDGCIEWVEVDGVLCPVFGNLIKRTLAKIPETYIEYSPSRTGAHFIVKANPKQAIKYQTEDGDIEIYAEGRYFTMTGDVIDSAPVADATEAVDEIVSIILGERNQASPQPAEATSIANVPMAYLSIEERLEIALHHAANSEQIKKLFDGDISDYKTAENEGRSEADMALCRYLAFYAEGNPTLLIEMMMRSALVRPKWNSRRGDNSWLGNLVKQVLSTEKKFYEPAKSFMTNTGATPSAVSRNLSARRYKMVSMGEAALLDRKDPNGRGLEVGGSFFELDHYFRPKRKLLTIIVGDPGTGKTTLFINYAYHMAKAHQLRAGFTSFENDPIDLTHSLVQAHLQKPTFPEFDDCCTDEEFLRALDQVGSFFTFWSPNWDESNVQSLSEYWDEEIKLDGLDILLLDPFSNLQTGKPKPNERLALQYTDFVREQLGFFRSYVQSRSLFSFLLCHPTKNFDRRQGAPRLNDINGSGDFFRAADYGIGIARDQFLTIEIQKIRKWRTGSEGKIGLMYNILKGQYSPTPIGRDRKNRKTQF